MENYVPLRLAVRATPPMIFLEFKRGPNGSIFHHDVELCLTPLLSTTPEGVASALQHAYPDVYSDAVPMSSVRSVLKSGLQFQ
jgi:hypothetical protein